MLPRCYFGLGLLLFSPGVASCTGAVASVRDSGTDVSAASPTDTDGGETRAEKDGGGTHPQSDAGSSVDSSVPAPDGGTRGTDAGQLSQGDGGASPAGPVTIGITPKSAQISVGGQVQFTAAVSGTGDQSAVWAVQEGAQGGSVSSAGQYIAPTSAGTYHVIAKSNADPTKTDAATIVVTLPAGTHPALSVGVWTNISPAGVPFGQIGENQTLAEGIAIDPSNPATLYECVDAFNSTTFASIPGGIYKSTDAGNTWNKVGNLDAPVRVAVDPTNSQHLYAADGVRGNTIGFWSSQDGGATWTQPSGFKSVTAGPTIGTADTYSMAVDPGDFQHILLSFHYGWTNQGTYTSTAGVLESSDGGESWVAHPPASGQAGLGFFIMFLSNPALSLGNRNTWLLGTQTSGFWKTEDAGASWTQVSTNNMAHEGTNLFYSKSGVVYVGAADHPMRSTDNGSTWTTLTSTNLGYYSAVQGDGTKLYVQQDGFTSSAAPFQTSDESDGITWVAQASASPQTFIAGPAQMVFDPANNIIYASMYEAGLWALKTK